MSCARDILLFVLSSCTPTGLGPGADEAFVFTDVGLQGCPFCAVHGFSTYRAMGSWRLQLGLIGSVF